MQLLLMNLRFLTVYLLDQLDAYGKDLTPVFSTGAFGGYITSRVHLWKWFQREEGGASVKQTTTAAHASESNCITITCVSGLFLPAFNTGC